MRLNLSNFLTLSRIILSPFIVITIMQEKGIISLLLFCVAATTDALDGYTARLFNLESSLGAYLDPVADKVLLLSCFGALVLKASMFKLPLWFFLFMAAREMIIIFGALLIKSIKRDFLARPTVFGKLNTVFLIIFIFFNLISSHFSLLSEGKLRIVLFFVTAFSFFSLMHYIKIGINQIRDKLA